MPEQNNNCTTQALYDSLNYYPGQQTLPGIRRRVYFINVADIVKWPTKTKPTDSGATMEGMAKLTGAFELASNKKWKSIDGLVAKGNVSCEPQGEVPFRTFLNTLTLTSARTDASAAGLCAALLNEQYVFLAQQQDGRFRLIGSQEFDVTINPSHTLGEGVTGEAGTTVEVQATDTIPAPFYPGVIELEGGKISGETGEVVTP